VQFTDGVSSNVRNFMKRWPALRESKALNAITYFFQRSQRRNRARQIWNRTDQPSSASELQKIAPRPEFIRIKPCHNFRALRILITSEIGSMKMLRLNMLTTSPFR
jgi:hypothetical protein